ncbi:uncharacterized protein LOC107728744 [Sinocyclocheilus rhinocerous]|uniref:uncharacterized protein LOC107728744 n=1 Tax=Sinocyclocheilus rhinocerous TaxID=307959 RepID=UPI0007B84C49|nr:PREDICTED: uncharacterized protein LOC107728744 [Sinocyclocheilus rhinocerous]
MKKKKRIKELGPDRPYLQIHQQSSDRGRAYTRGFSSTSYGKRSWLAGCDVSHAFYCFPCLLFQSPGTKRCGQQQGIAEQLDEGYRIGIRRHNEELALRGHDESETSDNPGIFRGLVDFVASLDFENATVFKGTSKTVQNELLDCMLSVVREHIIQEARSSDFLSIQPDETTDIATQCQLVLVLRYIDAKSNVQERFFEFIPLHSTTADSIATALKERLAVILPEDQKRKLISQAYDGASVMRGTTAGVQRKMQDVYPNAHYIHCYEHQLNLIMQQATSHIPKLPIDYRQSDGTSTAVPSIQCLSTERTSSAVFKLYETQVTLTLLPSERQEPLPCCWRIRILSFFLQLFHNIMPHVDLLYAKLQKDDIDSVHIRGSIQQFQQDIQKIRNSLHSLVDQSSEGGSQPKKQRSLSPEVHERIAAEVCDTVLRHTLERFPFTDHLINATLRQADRFEQYKMVFPEDALSRTLKAYPVLDGSKLKTELSLIYCKEEFRACCGALDLLQLFMENNLEEVFSETVTLLKILVTTPMTTAEAERCFSTLKRIKTFLRNSMTQERLNALAMLSMKKRLLTEMTDFNQKVIEKCASQKERRANFIFK